MTLGSRRSILRDLPGPGLGPLTPLKATAKIRNRVKSSSRTRELVQVEEGRLEEESQQHQEQQQPHQVLDQAQEQRSTRRRIVSAASTPGRPGVINTTDTTTSTRTEQSVNPPAYSYPYPCPFPYPDSDPPPTPEAEAQAQTQQEEESQTPALLSVDHATPPKRDADGNSTRSSLQRGSSATTASTSSLPVHVSVPGSVSASTSSLSLPVSNNPISSSQGRQATSVEPGLITVRASVTRGSLGCSQHK